MGVGIKIPKKKKPIARRVSNKGGEPEYTGSAELSGEAYGRLRRSAADFYRMEFKPSDFKLWVLAWAKESDKWKDKLEVLKKLPDYEFRSSIGGSCRMLSKGIVDVHPGFNEYWAGLAGTMGEVKPLTDFINKHLTTMYERGQVIAEASKKIETQKKTMKPTPSIQERIRDQACEMTEEIDVWLDTWSDDPTKFDPKGFDVSKHLRSVSCTQAHARKIRDMFMPEVEEISNVVNFPKAAELAKMNEYDQETYLQYQEAYSCYDKKALKVRLEAFRNLMGSLEVIVETAKATRKPRKRVVNVEKLVSKIKYAKQDDKFKLASINPLDIVYASELWVFNVKTRKIGRYIAKNIDPLKAGREGSGLSVKGTTIIGFNEELSIQKTIRKPEEKLTEFKSAGKRKLEKFLDEINAVDIKLNGRINADTILLKAVQ